MFYVTALKESPGMNSQAIIGVVPTLTVGTCSPMLTVGTWSLTLSFRSKNFRNFPLSKNSKNGKTNIVKLPVEIWEKGGKYTLRFNSTGPLKKVVVDPEKMLPYVNTKNNTWTSGKE